MIELKKNDVILLKENPHLRDTAGIGPFGRPLPKDEAIALLKKHFENKNKNIHNLHSSLATRTEIGSLGQTMVSVDYHQPHLQRVFENICDKVYRFFTKLFGFGKISKLKNQTEYSPDDLQRWERGANNFRIFWGNREPNPETDLFQSLFLGERPVLVINSLSNEETKKLQEAGFDCVNKGRLDYNNCGIEGGSFVFDRVLLEKLMQRHPDLYSDFKSPEDLIGYISSSINELAPENEIRQYCLRTGLALGYPLESCKGFADMCILQSEATIKSRGLGIATIPNHLLVFAIKYFCKLAKTLPEPEKKQEAKDIVGLLNKQAKLLLNAYNNLKNIASYGVNWMPFGEITTETQEKVDRLCAAFGKSGIRPVFQSTFAESVYERRFHNIRKLKSAIGLSDELLRQ